MILTSYFAKHKSITESGREIVSISRFSPRWLPNVKEIKSLAPSASLLSDYKVDKDESSYTKRYTESISLHDIDRVKDNQVLCCYEKATDFCHRGALRSMLARENILALEFKDSYSLFIVIEDNELTKAGELMIKSLLNEMSSLSLLISSKVSLDYITSEFKNITYEPFTTTPDADIIVFITNSHKMVPLIRAKVSAGKYVIRFFDGNRSLMFDYLASR